MNQYDPQSIEPKWQKYWEEQGLFKTPKDATKENKFYILPQLPYPSGSGLHVGHSEVYNGCDIYARYQRMKGKKVLQVMGWDSFGLPAENYAIKTNVHPRKSTNDAIDNFRKQIKALGISVDWDREVGSHNPDYYKWTQWFFQLFYRHGLAYRKKQSVNWCETDKTVLANEQVLNDGTCERCGTVVVQREMEQWYIKITDYADKLLEGLDRIDWPEESKKRQKDWIGRSEGAEIDFAIRAGSKPNFLILHGFTGKPSKNFIPSLKRRLEEQGFVVQTPELPNTDNPKESEQVDFVLSNCTIDENTIIVGHSLGGVVAMKALLRHGKPIAGLILVAPAMDPQFAIDKEDRPFWNTFTWDFDYKALQSLTAFRKVLSDVQEKQRVAYLEFLSQKLNATLETATAAKEHFTGEEEPFIAQQLMGGKSITVFTTRPDTIFGATYMVLAPEHVLVKELAPQISNFDEVKAYIEATTKKTELDRQTDNEKTGVELKGIKAINPVSGEETPVWIADYVLATYGTGAIMAVPAHDERDFEFAQKFGLPMKQVVCESVGERKGDEVWSNGVYGIVRDETGKFLIQYDKKDKYYRLAGGTIRSGEEKVAAMRREFNEETGFVDFVVGEQLDQVAVHLLRVANGEHIGYIRTAFAITLTSKKVEKISSVEDRNRHEYYWMDCDEALASFAKNPQKTGEERLVEYAYSGKRQAFILEGIVVNSGFLDSLTTKEAKEKIIQYLEEKGVGKKKIQFKLRDWSVSRQRFWGAPIPMISRPREKADKVGIVHGFTGQPDTGWKFWLREMLEKDGYDVIAKQFPGDEKPVYNEWMDLLSSYGLTDRSTLIGHSLGGYTALKYAERHKLKQLILVAPQHAHIDLAEADPEDVENWKNIQKFVVEGFDVDAIVKNVEEIVFILSTNDSAVLKSSNGLCIKDFEKFPNVEIRELFDRGHFSNNEGCNTIPELLDYFDAKQFKTLGAKDLPVLLPDDVDFKPTGQSPLTYSPSFQNGVEEKYGKGWQREVDTLDTFMCSSWYYYRYLDPKNDQAFASPEALKTWMPVDFYLGGPEHVNGHLLYSRFFTKVLYDAGYISFDEPFTKHRHQGLILGEDSRKMSKRWGNVINPTDVVNEFGADTIRTYQMFMGPLEDDKPWSTDGVRGVRKFLDRVWRLQEKISVSESEEVTRELHKTIKKLSSDMEEMKFNTAIAKMMELTNVMTKAESITKESFETFMKILSPFAPHMAEEIWSLLGHTESISSVDWPIYDEKYLVEETMKIAIQVNGKLRDEIEVGSDATEEVIKANALATEKIQKWLEGKEPKKVIYVKGKLVSIVV